MVRIVPALLLALSAFVASPAFAQDFAAVPGLAALPPVEIGQDATAPVFVNDVNSPASASSNAAAVSNGFNTGLPEVRSYVAPQLVAPQIDAFPQPVPQNVAAAKTIANAAQPATGPAAEPTVVHPLGTSPTEPAVASDADPSAVQPVAAAAEPTVASDADLTAAQPASSSSTEPIAASEAELALARANMDTYFAFSGTHPTTAAAAAAPNEERAAVDEPRPLAAAASGASSEERSDSTPEQPLAVAEAPATVATAVPEATTPVPTEANAKATIFKSDNAKDKDTTDHGARIATFFAAGAACALAIAGVAYARKRKMVYAKTPGTPKNELTFFHVQSRLTPPAV